jgi:hypothetical protein
MRPVLNGNVLSITIGDPDKTAPGGWKPLRLGTLLPDHGHLMHLYAIRMPQMDAVYHLHPSPVWNIDGLNAAVKALPPGSGPHLFSGVDHSDTMRETLPAMPPGTYKLFADVVYFNGFSETEVATLTIPPNVSQAPLAPEDASATPTPLSAGELGPSYKLPDGYTMQWQKPASIAANRAYVFEFTLLDPNGKPASDMQPYLGMAGHAAFVKTDFSAFAHTHPEGSAAMPAMMLAGASTSSMESMPGMPTPDPAAPAPVMSPTVGFPYGFPAPGRYRIFIQMKHGSTVETGVFDAVAH